MSKWLKSIKKHSIIDREKFNRVTIDTNKNGLYLIKTHKGKTVIAGPYETREEAIQKMEEKGLKDRFWEPRY